VITEERWRICVSSESGDFEVWLEATPRECHAAINDVCPLVIEWAKNHLPSPSHLFIHVEKYPEERQRLVEKWGLAGWQGEPTDFSLAWQPKGVARAEPQRKEAT
jgi:hypothetical protein